MLNVDTDSFKLSRCFSLMSFNTVAGIRRYNGWKIFRNILIGLNLARIVNK